MRKFLYVLFAFAPFSGLAQPGHYFLSQYVPDDKRIDHVTFDMVQDYKGILYFATRAGVLSFDGRSWDLIPAGGAVYTVELGRTGEVYWGGARGFGRISTGSDGGMTTEAYCQKEGLDIYQATSAGGLIYFLSDNGIYFCNAKGIVGSLPADDNKGSFTSIAEIFDVPYVTTERGGLYAVRGQRLITASFDIGESPDLIFSSRSEDEYLIATAGNRIFICSKDLSVTEIVPDDHGYVKASAIVGGCWIKKDLIAVGTLRGGVVFMDPQSGSIQQIINYGTGLPDNEIYAMMKDRDKNVWVSHDYGLTRIAPFMPFRSYSHYEGLRGNLLCALTFNNEVYVGTSVGLFKLQREEIYDQITYFVEVPNNEAQKPEVETRKRWRFLGFFKRKRKEAEGAGKGEPGIGSHAEVRKEKKVKTILRASQYAYRKVEGITSKISHLDNAGGQLLASGLGGIYLVQGLSSTPVLEEPVRLVHYSRNSLLLASTYSDRIRCLSYREGKWQENSLSRPLLDQISGIFDGDAGEVWLCGMDSIYQVRFQGTDLAIERSYGFDNPGLSRTSGVWLSSKPVLANANGFFELNVNRRTITRMDSMASPKTQFASPANLWYRDDHTWNLLGEAQGRGNAHLLNLCNDIRFIGPVEYVSDLWVIDGNHDLYKFLNVQPEQTAEFPPFLKSVTQGNKVIPATHSLTVNQEEGVLSFNVVQPTYSGARHTEYRYRLSGLNKDWSEWSTNNNQINFPYLPPGNYQLNVQVRDIFGNTHEMMGPAIRVRPPFWQTSWFYAMELTTFALLGFLSLKLSIRYRLISRFLALLTIILLIEFIQTLAGYTFSTGSSPVVDFALQVLVAFVVLPVEGFLRNLMFKSLNSQSRLLNVITDLSRREKEKNKSV